MSEPKDEMVTFYQTESTTVYHDPAQRGPVVPYGRVDHGNGHFNNGYFELKGHPEAASQIPEAVGWPELAAILAACAEPCSPYRSLGCEKFPRPVENAQPDGPQYCIGSYVNVALADVSKSTEDAMVMLAKLIADHIGDMSRYWIDFEIAIEQFYFHGEPGYCLLLRATGAAPSEQDARNTLGYACKLLQDGLKAAAPQFAPPAPVD